MCLVLTKQWSPVGGKKEEGGVATKGAAGGKRTQDEVDFESDNGTKKEPGAKRRNHGKLKRLVNREKNRGDQKGDSKKGEKLKQEKTGRRDRGAYMNKR